MPTPERATGLRGPGRLVPFVALLGLMGWPTGPQLAAAPPAQPAAGEPTLPFTWVRIDEAGNPADPATGLGAVAAEFMLGEHEVTNEQFCLFLNSSACAQRNMHGIAWRQDVAGNAIGPTKDEECGNKAEATIGILRTQLDGGTFQYKPCPFMGHKPVVNLRWCDAARFVNWLHNGANAEAATDTGAYMLEPDGFSDTYAVKRQVDAKYWIPSLDEWYKAAFFCPRPVNRNNTWKEYPTYSGNQPGRVKAGLDGNGHLPPKGESANFDSNALWTRCPGPPFANVTTVGSNGNVCWYEAFDMAGNARELVSKTTVVPLGVEPVACGGDFSSKAADLHRKKIGDKFLPRTGGLRLARSVRDGDPPAPPRAADIHLRAVQTLQAMQLPDPLPPRATPEAFELKANELRGLQKRLQAQNAPPPPDKIINALKKALDALGEAKRLAVQRQAQINGLQQQQLILPGAAPAGRLLEMHIDDQFGADLRRPYNEFKEAQKAAELALPPGQR
jgi:hypothetical protein